MATPREKLTKQNSGNSSPGKNDSKQNSQRNTDELETAKETIKQKFEKLEANAHKITKLRHHLDTTYNKQPINNLNSSQTLMEEYQKTNFKTAEGVSILVEYGKAFTRVLSELERLSFCVVQEVQEVDSFLAELNKEKLLQNDVTQTQVIEMNFI